MVRFHLHCLRAPQPALSVLPALPLPQSLFSPRKAPPSLPIYILTTHGADFTPYPHLKTSSLTPSVLSLVQLLGRV